MRKELRESKGKVALNVTRLPGGFTVYPITRWDKEKGERHVNE